jgi:hypothetical protein
MAGAECLTENPYLDDFENLESVHMALIDASHLNSTEDPFQVQEVLDYAKTHQALKHVCFFFAQVPFGDKVPRNGAKSILDAIDQLRVLHAPFSNRLIRLLLNSNVETNDLDRAHLAAAVILSNQASLMTRYLSTPELAAEIGLVLARILVWQPLSAEFDGWQHFPNSMKALFRFATRPMVKASTEYIGQIGDEEFGAFYLKRCNVQERMLFFERGWFDYYPNLFESVVKLLAKDMKQQNAIAEFRAFFFLFLFNSVSNLTAFFYHSRISV